MPTVSMNRRKHAGLIIHGLKFPKTHQRNELTYNAKKIVHRIDNQFGVWIAEIPFVALPYSIGKVARIKNTYRARLNAWRGMAMPMPFA